MLPPMRQRLVMFAVMIAVGWLYLQGAPAARAADGSAGATLVFAASPAGAGGWFAGLTMIAAVGGAVVAALGNPLAGVFAVAAGLAAAAVTGGPIDTWMRNVEGPSAYWGLVGETLIWAVMAVVAGAVIYLGGRMIGARLPGEGDKSGESSEEKAADSDEDQRSTAPLAALLPTLAEEIGRTLNVKRTWVVAIGAGVLTTLIAMLACSWLLQSTLVYQSFWGILLAFFIGAFTANLIFPSAMPIGTLISPFIAAAAFYAMAAMGDEMLVRAFFRGEVWHGATALPIFYASAGVAGAAMGVGMAEVWLRGDQPTQAPASGSKAKPDAASS